MSNFVLLTQQAAAPLVRAGRTMFYAKTDNRVYYKTTAGEQRVPLEAATSEPFPVGSVFIAVVSSNPGTLLGYGTWVAFAAGKMLVGLNASDVDFDVVEETGGSKTHTQTVPEMPIHTHIQDAHNHTQDAHGHSVNGNTASLTAGASWAAAVGTNKGVLTATDVATATNQAATATNQNAGGGDPMNVMNPYIVVYMWKRTA